MRRTNWLFLTLALVALPPVVLAQGSGCKVTVTAPVAGNVWIVDQTYTLTWRDNGQCYGLFSKVDLLGRSATTAPKVVDARTNVSNDGTLPYTPTADVLGYDTYVFRFWMEGGESAARSATIVGTSEEFSITAAAAPLVVDPSALSFFLPEGDETAAKTVYVLSNQGTVSWTAASDQAWMVPSPSTGVSTEGAGAVPVTVTAGATGLAPGTYSGSLTFTEADRAAGVSVVVMLTISSGGGGIPDLDVAPRRLGFTHRLGQSGESQTVVLSNTGTGGTPWKAESPAEWVTISPSSGYLVAGASAEVRINVAGSFTVPGSHRTFVHFKGSNDTDAFCMVGLNLNTGAVPGEWPPSGLFRGDSLQTLPVAANAPGAYDSFWSTDVVVLPTGPAAQAAHARHKLRALETAPSALALLGEARLLALKEALDHQAQQAAPRGTTQFIWGALAKKARAAEATITEMDVPEEQPTLYLDILGQFFDLTGISSFLQILGPGADDLMVASRTYSTDADEETYGQSVQAPTPQEIIGPEGGTAFVPGLRYAPDSAARKGWRSNLFITEIGGVATPVTVQLRDTLGAPVGTLQSKTLEPFTQWQIINTALSFGITTPWTYAEVTSAGGGQIVALGSVADNGSNDPTTIVGLVASPGARAVEDLTLPAIVRTPGAYGTNWRADITLLNASSSTVNLKAQFIPMVGSGAEVLEAYISLQPHAMGVYLDAIYTLFQKESGAGTLRLLQVDPGTFFAFNRIYNIVDEGLATETTYGQGTNAYRPADAVALDDGTLYTLGLERSPKYRTNVGVVEVGGAAAKVLFTVIAPTGESRGYLTSLSPGQWVQADDIIRNKVGFTEDFANVWVMINVVEGAGKVIGYGSIIDNDSSDATYIKLEKR